MLHVYSQRTTLAGSSGFAAAVTYTLRREPLYHKLQYSKVPKFDAAAAALGVIVGAFAAYLGLSSLGSAGADLSDLTALCWYVAIWLGAFRCLAALGRSRSGLSRTPATVISTWLFEVGAGVYHEVRLVWLARQSGSE
jgi:hypothetical protein